MGYGFVNIGDHGTRGKTPSYTYDAQGQIIAVDFGNGIVISKVDADYNGDGPVEDGWQVNFNGIKLNIENIGMDMFHNNAVVPRESPYGSDSIDLGSTYYKWANIYAISGMIQTSDRLEKANIHYLADPVAAISDPHSDDGPDYDGLSAPADEITYADIEDFVKQLSAATFVYKCGIREGVIDPAAVQLGLIADDICDHKLYPYIGTSHQTAEGIKRGLQPIPLAVTALVMCQKQAEQIEELTARVKNLEEAAK